MRASRMRAAAAWLLVAVLAHGAVASAHDMAAMGGNGARMSPNAMAGDMKMDAHMVMTPARRATPYDLARAHLILSTLRRALRPYRDYKVALRRDYEIFLPSWPQAVYHFVNYSVTGREYKGDFDLSHPGALLYVKKRGGGYVLVGVMYSAPAYYTLDQLDARVPLGVARWHVHVNVCLPVGITLNALLRGYIGGDRDNVPGMIPVRANPEARKLDRQLGFLADGRFGFTGSIADEAACAAAGGHLIPRAFGWMVHVYPFSGDAPAVAFGTSVPKPLAQ